MTRRPPSLTVIGLLFLAGAILTPAFLILLSTGSPMVEGGLALARTSRAGAAIWGCVGAALTGAAGYGILGGRAWARRLYLWGSPAMTLVRSALHGFSLFGSALPLANYLIIAWLLVRAPARTFFETGPHPILTRRDPGEPPERGAPRAVKWLSLPFFALGQHLCFTYAFSAAGLLREFGPRALTASPLVALPGAGLGCLAIALALWGPPRWRGVAGAILTVTGVEGLGMGGILRLAPYLPPEALESLGGTADMEMIVSLGTNLLILGAAALPVGCLLSYWQRIRDRARVAVAAAAA